jgi:hypothetical protein
MACGKYPDKPINYWLDWNFVDGAVCVYGDQIGVSVTMLLFFGVTFLTLYQSSDSILVPVAVLIVLAPMVIVLLPAVGVQFGVIILVLGLAIVGYYAYLAA